MISYRKYEFNCDGQLILIYEQINHILDNKNFYDEEGDLVTLSGPERYLIGLSEIILGKTPGEEISKSEFYNIFTPTRL